METNEEKRRMYAMAEKFTMSMMAVISKSSPIYVGDENLYVTKDKKVSKYEIVGAILLATSEMLDITGLNGHPNEKRVTTITELLHLITDVVIDITAKNTVMKSNDPDTDNSIEEDKDTPTEQEMSIVAQWTLGNNGKPN